MKARMFEVKINLGNADMQHPWDVKHALLELAEKMGRLGEFDGDHGSIMDINGCTVGSWGVK